MQGVLQNKAGFGYTDRAAGSIGRVVGAPGSRPTGLRIPARSLERQHRPCQEEQGDDEGEAAREGGAVDHRYTVG